MVSAWNDRQKPTFGIDGESGSAGKRIMLKKLFPRERLGKLDYFVGGALLAACWILFFHGDIWATGWDSLHYLFGKPLDFYEACVRARGFGGAYLPTIYAIYALWLYPLKLFGLVKDANHLPYNAVYWLKTLTTILYVTSGLVFYKITRFYCDNKDWSKYAAVIWLTAPLALFSQFIFSQSDIFYVLLTLIGLLMFLRGKSLTASLCFGLAITFKYFPAFAFVPLLLLLEKRAAKILMCLFLFSVPTMICRFLYGRSPAFVEEVMNHNALGRVYAAFMDIGGGWQIYYLFALFTILCCWAYLADISKERLPSVVAYVFLVSSILPFLFILWHPQWIMSVAPAIALTTVIDRRCKRFLLLDLVGMLCFTAFVSLAFRDNVDAAMLKSGILGINFSNSYKMAELFSQFHEHSASVFLSAFWGYLVVHLVLKLRPAMEGTPIQDTFFVDYSDARYRFYVGLLIFLLPVSFSVYLSNKRTVHLIDNELSDKQNYGELVKGRSFVQSFIAKGEYMEEVDLLLATFARPDSGLVVLEILDSNNGDLARIDRPIESIKDNAWAEFSFGRVKIAKGATYRIRLTSPTGQTGNAITWWASLSNTYLDGNAIVDGVPRDTDFGFRVKFSR